MFVAGGPKLVKIDLATNKVVQTITLDENVAPKRSYLNDVRVDTKTGHAFITESGTGAILVVDLKSGKARRLLANNPSTKLEPEVDIVVDGMKIIRQRTSFSSRRNRLRQGRRLALLPCAYGEDDVSNQGRVST